MRIGPLGIWELLIILVVILVVFGPRRLPEMAKGIGQSVREFRKGIKDMREDFREGAEAKPQAAPDDRAAPEDAVTPYPRTAPDATNASKPPPA